MDMKVFGIGLGRTGTTSLAKALDILGYSCVHYPYDDAAIDAHDAAVDETVACQFKRLDEKYRDGLQRSKFVYTCRPISPWIASYARCWAKVPEDAEYHPVIVRTYKKLYGQETFDREAWEKGYARHALLVLMHFDSSRLLKMDITNGDGWKKLCPFLGKPVPDEPFPCLNAS